MAVGSRRSQVTLAEYTSFKVGGVAAECLQLPCTAESVALAVSDLDGRKWFMLGGGTNVLVADTGFDGVVVQFDDRSYAQHLGGGRYRVSANTKLEDFVSEVCGAGLYGLELLAGIPGSVGGALVQNAGAYEQELKGAVESVLCVNCETAETETLSNKDCEFSYRDSVFKRSSVSRIIVECVLKLSDCQQEELTATEVLKELEKRAKGRPIDLSPSSISAAVHAVRLPKDHILGEDNPSAGSFFKNPRPAELNLDLTEIVKTFEQRRDALVASGATWIGASTSPIKRHKDGTEELVAGLLIATSNDPGKPDLAYSPGRALGRLRLGAGGANTIVNTDGACAADVLALAREMQSAVLGVYGLTLQNEVVLVGDISLEQP